MNLEALLGYVKPEWHKAFLHFIDTGEADDAFLEYLNTDKKGQQAVEQAFTSQAKAIEGLAEELKNSRSQAEEVAHPVSSISTNFAKAVEGLLELSPDQRHEVVREAASNLTRSARPKQWREVEDIAEVFKENVRVAKV